MSRILKYIFISLMLVSIYSCGDDNDEPIDNNNHQTVPDPVGSVTLILPGNGTSISLGSGLYETNYLHFRDNQIGGVYCVIADLGEFSNLGAVTGEFPVVMNQWAVAQLRHGYIVKFNDDYNTIYSRIYVTKAVTGVDGNTAGLEIKYEYDWREPFKVPIEFKTSSMMCSTYYKKDGMKWNYIMVRIPYVNPVKVTSVTYDKSCPYIDDVVLRDNCLTICFDVEKMPSEWSDTFTVTNEVNTQSITLKRNGSQNFSIVS